LSEQRASALSIIDEAGDIVSRAAGFVGLLWITSLPARLSLAWFVARLLVLRKEAGHHGNELLRLAWLTLVLWLVSLWGRHVFVRATRHSLQSTLPPPSDLVRGSMVELLAYAVSAAVIELFFWMLLVTFVMPAMLLVLAGVAAAAGPKTPRAALKTVFDGIGSLWMLLRLSFFFVLALAVVLINLHSFAQGALWAASGLAPVDVAVWTHLLQYENPTYSLLLIAGGMLLLEPFWLAALTVHVERVRARSSGEDLRRWFDGLRVRA
jgi:hypothetical protein